MLFLTLLLRSFYLFGDLFVFRVLSAFGFGHRFSCWFFVWEYFLSGSVRYCSEYVVHVLGGFFPGEVVLIADFSVFSLAYLCGSVWGNGARFGTSIFLLFVILVIKGVFYFLRIPFPFVVGLSLFSSPFPFWLRKSPLLKHFPITGIY